MAYSQATGSSLGYVQVVAGAGGKGLYDFAAPQSRNWGQWSAALSRCFSFAEYTSET